MKNPKILILGTGFIGRRLHSELRCEITNQKINSIQDSLDLINSHKPQILLNCVGRTGERNVDDCELNPQTTIQANTFVPILLAEACLRNRVKLVHVSSGCIYHYDYSHPRPIRETQNPDFFDLYYSRTKIYAETVLTGLSQKYNILIARIRVPLDDRPHHKNVLTKLIKFNKIIDLPNSITYIPDFIKALKHLLKINATGIFNIVNKGGLRYPKLLNVYKKHMPQFRYEVINYKKLNLIRTNLVLSTKKLENSGFKVRHIHTVLNECIKSYLERIKKIR